MARKRKQTEQTAITLEELPRAAKELTSKEAEAAKGGSFSVQQQEDSSLNLRPGGYADASGGYG
jgi:hypothetical protein